MSSSEVSSPETAEAVLAALRACASETGLVTVGTRALGSSLGIGSNTAHRALRRLQADGRIAVQRIGTGGKYRTTYLLTEVRP